MNKKIKEEKKMYREAKRFIDAHKLAAFDIYNCTRCGHCASSNHPTQIGYRGESLEPIPKKMYNQLRHILRVPLNNGRYCYHIDVWDLIDREILPYKGSFELLPDCSDDEDEEYYDDEDDSI